MADKPTLAERLTAEAARDDERAARIIKAGEDKRRKGAGGGDGQADSGGARRIRWGLINDQWIYVIGFTAYCGLAGSMAGNDWIGLLTFPCWYGFAVLGASDF